MDFHVLGPLEVTDGNGPVQLGRGRQRALLALLLLSAGRPVGADRIVEELWGGDAPATAGKVVQNLVSQLRRSLGEEAVATRGRAYALVVAPGSLDAERFEALLDDGRRALGAGRPDDAARLLRAALALWRGPPLGDLGDEPWARAEVARLEERRLVALERRIEADLALGRHADLVGELEGLVAREPLREGLRAQLMLALYRSGRQAEALEAFQDARRTLVGELGIEPGPALADLHAAILRQDPALAAPAATPTVATDAGPRPEPVSTPGTGARPGPTAGAGGPPRPRDRRRRAGALLLAGGVLVAVAAAVLAGRDRPAPARGAGGELVAFGLGSGAVERRVAAGRTPTAVAAGGGDTWVIDADARTLVRVPRDGGAVETLATGATPIGVAVRDGSVWVANGTPREDSPVLGSLPAEVVRLDAATRTERAVVRLPRARDPVLANGGDQGIAVSRDAVWAVSAGGEVVRIDPATAAITASTGGIRASAVAAGGAGVWALAEGSAVVAIDERTGRVDRRVRLPTASASALAVGAGAAWVTSSVDGRLWRVGASGGGVVGAVDVGSGAAGVAAADGGVWVANPVAGTITAVDPRTVRVSRVLRVGGVPRALAVDGATVWMALTRGAPAATSRAAGVRTLPPSMCEPVVAGPDGRADVLVVSDLPLQSGTRLAATQMAQAIAFVLRRHGFRAGGTRVAYQSCDDALATTGLPDDAKCAANARAYARDPDVVAVIGTLNSACAVAALPELNRARGGPLAMVSPLNSFVGLTRQGPGVEPGLVATLYPTGRRNYARVYPPDDLQGAALALFARDRGARRAYVLDDGEPGYGALLATGFATAARQIGVRVAGRARWDPGARTYRRLAARVAAARPDAVFVGGLLATNAAGVMRALRGALGPGVDLLAPDGVTPIPLLRRAAGAAAEDAFVSVGGAVFAALPPAGADFVRRFGRTQPGAAIDPSALYAAQAAEVALDAIARSNASRASVLDALFSTHIRRGLLGDVRFDARGDLVESPMTVVRVVGSGASARTPLGIEGGAVERVVRPGPALVAPR